MQNILTEVSKLTGIKELRSFSPKLADVLAFEVAGKQAEKIWQALRKLKDSTGYWPLIVGEEIEIPDENDIRPPEEDRSEFENKLRKMGRPEEKIKQTMALFDAARDYARARAAATTAPEWFEARLASDNGGQERSNLHGDWPRRAQRNDRLAVCYEIGIFGKKTKPKVSIALIPTCEPWQAIARLRFGGWNDCPYPEEHRMVMKYWFENHAAVPAALTHDIVEMYADRPVEEREDTLKLAREQYAYCYDIVLQGTETLQALAAGLLNNPYWYFWWD